MKKNEELKQSKISRHEIAKEKFRFFERSMSCKSLNNKTDFVPIPGQFAIVSNLPKKKLQQSNELPSLHVSQQKQQKNEKSIKFTTNLKLITRERSPSRVSQLLNDTVNRKIDGHRSLKKITRSESSGNLRPYTALSTQLVNDLQGKNNLKESKIISTAVQHDKKYYLKKQSIQGNTFVVKSRTGIPKYAYGYKSIRLTAQDAQRKLKLQSEPKNERKFTKIAIQQQQSQKQNFFSTESQPNFLPIEYYMIEDQQPEDLIQKYKLKQNYMVGYSKWQNLQGNYEWKKCRVLDYIKDKQRWEIQWLHNGKRKIVARNNLYFEKQNFQTFEKIITDAENFRKHSEVYMKYNWLIDNMKTETHTLEQYQLTKIMKLVNNNLTIRFKSEKVERTVESLVEQVKEKYVRANHVVQFNAGLPFNVKYKQEFSGCLPERYFVPNSAVGKFDLKKNRPLRSEQKIAENVVESQKMIEKKVNPTHELKKLFETSNRKFNKITALSSPNRIHILQFLNKSQLQISTQQVQSPHDLSFHLSNQLSSISPSLKFFSFYPTKMYSLQDIIDRIDSSLFESIAKLNNIVCEVEYFVAKELDPLYADKKSLGVEMFDDMISGYRRFLGVVNMRIEAMGRQLLFGMLDQLRNLLNVDQTLSSQSDSESLFSLLKQQKKTHSSLKLKIKFEIKGQIIESQPKKQQITQTIKDYMIRLVEEFSMLSCIRKSYIQELRPKNKMKIVENLEQTGNGDADWKIHQELVKIREGLEMKVAICDKTYDRFYSEVKKVWDRILSLQGDIKRKTSKKSNFSDIEEYVSTIKSVTESLTLLKMLSINSSLNFKPQPSKRQVSAQQQLSAEEEMAKKISEQAPYQIESRFIKLGMFCFNIDDCIQKCESKLYQISYELYKLVLDKIIKQNQKMEKQIDTIIQRLEKQPANIKQMILLEQYIHQQASQELWKISAKINQLQDKFRLLEKLNIEIEYKDYYECHKIYMKPIKIRAAMNNKVKEIDLVYRKMFGEELVKEIGQLTQEIKQIEDKFYSSIAIKSIEEMDSSFIVFSKLKERIEAALTKSLQVNQYEIAMKWINTNFSRILEIKSQFMPYYQLISLQKNYRFHIDSQLTESLHSIEASSITQEVMNGCDQLSNLEVNVFYNNSTILKIVKGVGKSYTTFRDKLPLIQILRNTDLRQRHWNIIKQLTGFVDILSEKITFQQLEIREIKKYEKKLIEISHIATRELIYEKRLNKMKKQWKQLKIHMVKLIDVPITVQQEQSHSQNQLKIISNLEDIQTKTQKDIYQIQQILSSAFIKFLQKDILNWRNLTLYKMYEFVQIWKMIEKEIVQMYKMFSKSVMKNQASTEYQKFKALEKNWKNITTQIQQQPNVLELLQTKINESLKYTVELIEDLRKSVNQFFEKKKQRFSRFGALSQEQLIALYSNSNEQTQIFDQAVRKCLQGVKNVVRNRSDMITCIRTHLDEEIEIGHGADITRSADSLTPDRIIEEIEKRIKKSLRTSIDSIDELRERRGKILQIVLFHQRIIFTREVQNQLISSDNGEEQKGIKEGYLNALLTFKQKIIEALFIQYEKNSSTVTKKPQNLIKIQTELNQLINHIEIAQHLYRKNVTNVFDFEWVSQIRTYQNLNNYFVETGLNRLEYGFEITDQQQYVVEEVNCKLFCNLSMAMRQRMFGLLEGDIGTGKLTIFHYLAGIHGKNELIINCHKALSHENAFDFLRMCANGIWIVFNNINLLSKEVFSCFRQSVQLFWANYPTPKSKPYFMLGDKNITFSTHEIGLFGTLNTTKNNVSVCEEISHQLGNYFRTFSVPKMDVQYLMESKLLLAGFEGFNTARFLKMVEIVEQELEGFYEAKKNEGLEVYSKLTFSKLNFLEKVITFAKELKEANRENDSIQDYMILEQGLSKGIEQITKNLGTLKSQIISRLKLIFDFLITPQQKSEPQPSQPLSTQDQFTKILIKKLFATQNIHPSKNLVNHYFDIIQTLKRKHSVIVLGNSSIGKSLLIDLLQNNNVVKEEQMGDEIFALKEEKCLYIDGFKISLKHVHPNGYSLKELFGDVDKNGVVNCLIKEGYEELEKELNSRKNFPNQQPKPNTFQSASNTSQAELNPPQIASVPSSLSSSQQKPFHHRGIVFDSEISSWIEPLLPLIKCSSNYVQPNGKNLIIEHPLKLIFECKDVSSVSPSILLSTSIVHFEQTNIRWQDILSHFIKRNFKLCFQKKVFMEYCEVLVGFVMEPILQFFKSSISSRVSGKAAHFNHSQHDNPFIEIVYKCLLKNEFNYLPLIFNLFIALVEDFYKSTRQLPITTRPQSKTRQYQADFSELFSDNFDDKDRTVILNLFVMAVTWTLGLFIPEESKKTFSRHFKYLIKRAVQLNIKGVFKEYLPKDEDDIYEICFVKSKWYLWDEVPNIVKKNLTVEENYSSDMGKYLEDSIPLKTKTKYLHMLEKYCEANLPFFIVGKSSSGKNSLMMDFINKCTTETYNKILLACTPQTTQKTAKIELKKEMQKEKYSHSFRGFVHKKTTIFYVCDMNLPLGKNEPSLQEFLHEYLKRHGWYLDHTAEFFEFKNIIFCGTLNSSVKFSEYLLKYVNPLPYVESEDDIRSKLFSILEQNEFISPHSQNIVKLMTNLQQVVSRELKSKFMFGSFTFKDLCEVAESINQKITHYMFGKEVSMQSIESGQAIENEKKSTKKKILQCWIIETQKKYRQRFGAQYDQEKIFYFINNVLMEEQRTRYKNVLPSQNIFLSNLEYYLGKLRISEFKSMKKGYNSTKIFYNPSSFKLYQNLSQIHEDIESLEKVFEKTYDLKQLEEESLSREIQAVVDSNQNTNQVTCYIKSMTSMLDYLLEERSHLMFLIDDRKDEGQVKIATDHDRMQMESTLRQLFTFSAQKLKLLNSKFSKTHRSQMDRLLQYVSKINNSQLLPYHRNQQLNDTMLEWKLFITELFELINSPTSLHDRYIIHLTNLTASEMFILEDLLSLKRTGTLSMLQEYLNSEEIDLDDAVEEKKKSELKQPQENEEYSDEDDEEGEALRKRILAEEKKRRKNTVQLIREKILSKLRFVISIDESKLFEFKQNYSTLLQKCHILWFSHLYPTQQDPTNPSPQSAQPAESQQQTSLKTSIKSISSPSQKSITSLSQQQQQSNPELQRQNKLSLRNLYNDHKQVLNNWVNFYQAKDVYLTLHLEEWGKERVMLISQEIVACENVEFIKFLKLCQKIKLGIEQKVQTELKILQSQYNYFNSLSVELLPTLFNLISQKKSLLFKKQQQLSQLSQKIAKLSQEKQKFMSYFTKSEDAISLLQKQSRQANELYHQCVGLEEKNFTRVQFALVDLLKSAKDRKVLMTNEMKIYVEMFGLLIGKKIKPQQAMHKQIVKDIAALKVHKKVSNMLIQIPLGQKPGDKTTTVSEKAIAKLKQFLTKNLQAQFTKRTESKQQLEFKDNFKQLPFSEALLILLKEYFIYTAVYFNKTQQENIKTLNKKCLKCLKELSKTKDEYHKSLKSKQYEKVASDLDELQKLKLDLLNVYDIEKKLLEKLANLEKKTLEIVCLNSYGDVDQKEMALKNLIEKNQMSRSDSSNLNQARAHILVQKIKHDYTKQKQHLVSIITCKDVLSLLLASKIYINNLRNTVIETGVITKILSRQAIDLVRSVKLESWESYFVKDVDTKEESRAEEMGRFEKVDFVEYLLKDFNGSKVIELMTGVVCVERNEETEKWFERKTSRALRYDSSIVDKLQNAIIQSKQPQQQLQNINTVSQHTNALSQKSTISLTTQLIITHVTSLHDLQQFLTKLTECSNQLSEYLKTHSLILLYENLALESIKSTISEMKFILSQTNINEVNICTNQSEEVKFIQLIEGRIEDELSQDRKEADVKTMNKWKELKDSQQENFVQRKSMISNQFIQRFLEKSNEMMDQMGQTSRQNKIPTNQPLITLIQDQKLTTRSPPNLSQSFVSTHTELLTQLSTHLSQLRQNLAEYASINQAIQLLPNLINLKKKSTIQTTKLIKYIARIYLGLRTLQNQHLIIETTTSQRFSDLVLWMVQKEKQTQKGQTSQTKLIKQIKNRIWEYFIVTLNHRQLFVGVVFALAGQQMLTEIQFDKLLKLIVRMHIYATRITNVDYRLTSKIVDNSQPSQKPHLESKYHLIHNFILKPVLQKNQKVELSQTFQQVLELIGQNFSCFTDLKHNFKRKLNVWVEFLKNIEEKFGENQVNTLPEPYNDISRAYFGLFVALSHPEKLQNWVDVHLIQQDLTKLSEYELLSNESKILRMTKFSCKQTVLIGDQALSLLSSLSYRIRKQLRLYSRVSTSELHRNSSENSHRNSPALTRKEIPLKEMNQLGYFANRKLEKELVDQMFQCMKNSNWMVVDCDNLINSLTGEVEFHRLEAIVKLIDTHTSSSPDQQHEDEEHIETQKGLLESNSKNTNSKKTTKQQLTISSFETCDYQIFFVLSNHNKKHISKTTLLNNHKRCVLQINQENDVIRSLNLNQHYHEELIISKKMLKDYDAIDFSVKLIAYFGLKVLQQSLGRIINVRILNGTQLNALSVKSLTRFTKIREITDKLSKMLNLILQDPQYLIELLSPNKKILKLPVELQQDQKQSQQQKQKQRPIKTKNQPKTNSRFQKERNENRKKTLKLVFKPSIIQDDTIEEAYNQQKSIPKIGSMSRDSNKNLRRQPNKNKYFEVIELLKLFESYLKSSLGETELVSTGFMSLFKQYTEDYFVRMNTKSLKQDDEKQFIKKLQIILLGDPNKLYTSNRPILEELVSVITLSSKEKPNFEKLVDLNNAFVKNQFAQFNLGLFSFDQGKLFVERLVDGFRHKVNQENFARQIQTITELRKKCELQSQQQKKQLLPQQNPQNQTQKLQSSQFNFSSLTQNLTIEEMRKKLTQKSPTIQVPNPATIINEVKYRTAMSRLKEYLWKKKQEHYQQLDRKLTLLRSLKPVFLLQRVSYHCMWEIWKKSDKHHTLLNLVETLFELDDHQREQAHHKALMLNIDYFKKEESFRLTSFFNSSQFVPVFNFQSFRTSHELPYLLNLLKSTFTEANLLKSSHIKSHFFLQSREKPQKKSINHPTKSTTLYKICELEGFGMFGLQMADERISAKDKTKAVMTVNEQQGFLWSKNLGVKLGVYFEEMDEESDGDDEIIECEDINQQTQINGQAKTSTREVKFFLNKLTELCNGTSTNQHKDAMIDSVHVEVVKSNKIWDKHSINAYVFY